MTEGDGIEINLNGQSAEQDATLGETSFSVVSISPDNFTPNINTYLTVTFTGDSDLVESNIKFWLKSVTEGGPSYQFRVVDGSLDNTAKTFDVRYRAARRGSYKVVVKDEVEGPFMSSVTFDAKATVTGISPDNGGTHGG